MSISKAAFRGLGGDAGVDVARLGRFELSKRLLNSNLDIAKVSEFVGTINKACAASDDAEEESQRLETLRSLYLLVQSWRDLPLKDEPSVGIAAEVEHWRGLLCAPYRYSFLPKLVKLRGLAMPDRLINLMMVANNCKATAAEFDELVTLAEQSREGIMAVANWRAALHKPNTVIPGFSLLLRSERAATRGGLHRFLPTTAVLPVSHEGRAWYNPLKLLPTGLPIEVDSSELRRMLDLLAKLAQSDVGCIHRGSLINLADGHELDSDGWKSMWKYAVKLFEADPIDESAIKTAKSLRSLWHLAVSKKKRTVWSKAIAVMDENSRGLYNPLIKYASAFPGLTTEEVDVLLSLGVKLGGSGFALLTDLRAICGPVGKFPTPEQAVDIGKFKLFANTVSDIPDNDVQHKASSPWKQKRRSVVKEVVRGCEVVVDGASRLVPSISSDCLAYVGRNLMYETDQLAMQAVCYTYPSFGDDEVCRRRLFAGVARLPSSDQSAYIQYLRSIFQKNGVVNHFLAQHLLDAVAKIGGDAIPLFRANNKEWCGSTPQSVDAHHLQVLEGVIVSEVAHRPQLPNNHGQVAPLHAVTKLAFALKFFPGEPSLTTEQMKNCFDEYAEGRDDVVSLLLNYAFRISGNISWEENLAMLRHQYAESAQAREQLRLLAASPIFYEFADYPFVDALYRDLACSDVYRSPAKILSIVIAYRKLWLPKKDSDQVGATIESADHVITAAHGMVSRLKVQLAKLTNDTERNTALANLNELSESLSIDDDVFNYFIGFAHDNAMFYALFATTPMWRSFPERRPVVESRLRKYSYLRKSGLYPHTWLVFEALGIISDRPGGEMIVQDLIATSIPRQVAASAEADLVAYIYHWADSYKQTITVSEPAPTQDATGDSIPSYTWAEKVKLGVASLKRTFGCFFPNISDVDFVEYSAVTMEWLNEEPNRLTFMFDTNHEHADLNQRFSVLASVQATIREMSLLHGVDSYWYRRALAQIEIEGMVRGVFRGDLRSKLDD